MILQPDFGVYQPPSARSPQDQWGIPLTTALAFTGADADRVECGTGTSLDLDLGTILLWIKAPTLPGSALRLLFAKGSAPPLLWLNISGGANDVVCQRSKSAGSAVSAANWTSLPGAAAATDIFLAAQFDAVSGVAADQKMFCGNLRQVVREATAYSTQNGGGGTVSSIAGTTAAVGNVPGGGSFSWPGSIACIGVWGRKMPYDELVDQQGVEKGTTGMHPSRDCRLFLMLGQNGTGVQFDYSGRGNHGTVTGATYAQGPPVNAWAA